MEACETAGGTRIRCVLRNRCLAVFQLIDCTTLDVADVAWSQDDSMIASVGLDSTIYIWDGHNFGKPAFSPVWLATKSTSP